jgi:hypothetical protein
MFWESDIRLTYMREQGYIVKSFCYPYINGVANIDTLLYFICIYGRSTYNIFFLRSSDDGSTWNCYHEFELERQPYIGKNSQVVDNNNIYIIYTLPLRNHIGRVDSIMFSTSSTYGQSWSPVRGVVSHTNDFYYSWLKKTENRMHLTYQEHGTLIVPLSRPTSFNRILIS